MRKGAAARHRDGKNLSRGRKRKRMRRQGRREGRGRRSFSLTDSSSARSIWGKGASSKKKILRGELSFIFLIGKGQRDQKRHDKEKKRKTTMGRKGKKEPWPPKKSQCREGGGTV